MSGSERQVSLPERATAARVRLGDRVEVTMGRQRSPRHIDGEHVIPYLRAANVKDGELALDSVLSMNFSPAEQKKYALRRGDVLVTEGCGSLGQIGASAQWTEELAGPVAFQNTLLRLRAIEGLSDAGFVYQWARWAFRLGAFADAASGTSIFHIGAKRAAEMQFPDVPLAQQRRIGHVLEAVDAAEDAHALRRTQSWKLLDRMIDTLLTEPTWPTRRLDEVAEVGGGITKGRRSGETRTLPYLRVANVQHGRLDLADVREIEATKAEIERHRLESGDVLLLEGGNKEDVGRGWLWSGEIEPCLHQNHLHRARPKLDLVDPRFLAYAICRREARTYCLINAKQTSNLATINRTQIAALPVRVPPLSDQIRAVALLDAIRSDYEAVVTAIQRLRQLRDGLLTTLFSGAHEIPRSYDVLLADAHDTVREPLAV